MSVNLDAAGIGQLAVRLGLASDLQVNDCLYELEDKKAALIADRLAKVALMDAEIAKALEMKANTFELVPVK